MAGRQLACRDRYGDAVGSGSTTRSITSVHAQSETTFTNAWPRTPSASNAPGWSVPGTRSLPIVARIAGTGSPRTLGERHREPAARALRVDGHPTDRVVAAADLDGAVVCVTGERERREIWRLAGGLAGRREPGIGLEAGSDPSLAELRIGRVGVRHEVPAELVGRDRSHDDLELGTKRQEAGDDVAGEPGPLPDTEPVDRGGDQVAGPEVGHGAEVGS